MAPKITKTNFRYLSKFSGGLSDAGFPVNDALNTVIPGAGDAVARVMNKTQDAAIHADGNEDGYKANTPGPYEDLTAIKAALRFSDEDEANERLEEEKELKNLFRKYAADDRMKAYPAFAAYLETMADLLDNTEKGFDPGMMRDRVPGGVYFTDTNVDWVNNHDTAAKDINDLLTDMHWQEYCKAFRTYTDAKRALDDPAISPAEKRNRTAQIRQSLKDIETFAENVVQDDIAEKASPYYTNYDLNVRGFRGVNANVIMPAKLQMEALDMGWNPAFIEDYSRVKAMTELCRDSLGVFDQLNDPALDTIKENVRIMAELDPSGREFKSEAEFVEYYQAYSDASRKLYYEATKPEMREKLGTMSENGLFEAIYEGHEQKLNQFFPAKLHYGSSYGVYIDRVGFFGTRGDFASKGIIASNGELMYNPEALRRRENNIAEAKVYAQRLKNESKRFRNRLGNIENEDEAYNKFWDSLDALAGIKTSDVTIVDLNDKLFEIRKAKEAFAQAHPDMVPQGFDEWLEGAKDQMKKYDPDTIGVYESLGEQQENITNIRKKGISDKYVKQNQPKEMALDESIATFSDRIRYAHKLDAEGKNALKADILLANAPEAHPEDSEELRRERASVCEALNKGWNVTHALELPKLIKITEAADQYSIALNAVKDPKLDRFKTLLREVADSNPAKQDFTADNDGKKFMRYNAKSHAALRELVAESARPEVKTILEKMRVVAALNGPTINALTGVVGKDALTTQLKDAMDLMNPERYRFRGEPDIRNIVNDVTLEREKSAREDIGARAAAKFKVFEERLDGNINERFDSYLDMKTALAKVAGLKNGNTTPKRVGELLTDLYEKADKYSNFASGGERVAMAEELKAFVEEARVEYKTAVNGNLSEMTPVYDQRRYLDAKLGRVADPAAFARNDTAKNSLKDFTTDASKLLNDLRNHENFFIADFANRDINDCSDSYKALAGHMRKLDEMRTDLMNFKPKEVYDELKKTMESAQVYANEHSGLKGIGKATGQLGGIRLSRSREIFNHLKRNMAAMEMSYEGLAMGDQTKTISELGAGFGLNNAQVEANILAAAAAAPQVAPVQEQQIQPQNNNNPPQNNNNPPQNNNEQIIVPDIEVPIVENNAPPQNNNNVNPLQNNNEQIIVPDNVVPIVENNNIIIDDNSVDDIVIDNDNDRINPEDEDIVNYQGDDLPQENIINNNDIINNNNDGKDEFEIDLEDNFKIDDYLEEKAKNEPKMSKEEFKKSRIQKYEEDKRPSMENTNVK